MKHIALNTHFKPVQTVPVFGVGRGGTSMIAGCLRILGVSMGARPNPYKHEWSPLVLTPNNQLDRSATYQVIRGMDDQHPHWGWKSPSDAFLFEEIVSMLRRPGVIIVTRDLTEIALSGYKRQDVPYEFALRDSAVVYQHLFDRMHFWPWPILVIPFAQALQNPPQVIELLAEFLQLAPTRAARKQALKFMRDDERGYRLLPAKGAGDRDINSAVDPTSDAEWLAGYLNTLWSDQYRRHLEVVVAGCLDAISLLRSRVSASSEEQFAVLLQERLAWLGGSLGLKKLRAREETSFGNLLDRLTRLSGWLGSEAAARRFARHPSIARYKTLTGLYRSLQIALRLRAALQASLDLLEFEGFSPTAISSSEPVFPPAKTTPLTD